MGGMQMEQYVKACRAVEQKWPHRATKAVVLGSGLGFMTDLLEKKIEFSYAEIPGFPPATVRTQAGRMACGLLDGEPVLMMNGRFHYYEGHSMEQVVFPIRVLRLLGVQRLVLTNAAGGINSTFSPGTIMLITDHIKLMGDSPLRGINLEEFGPRFPDMSYIYTPALRQTALEVAAKQGITLREGVYGYAFGPQYETPAEVRALGILGADAVGMSTAPEAIAAAHCGMEVLGLSCISNMAAGITGKPLSDEEVHETAAANRDKLSGLVRGILAKL
ncbi:MAG: purine-nucleoside phosphorylase [Eubacteriales bacterium]|jgi:purine-nucleoside phosphorylase